MSKNYQEEAEKIDANAKKSHELAKQEDHLVQELIQNGEILRDFINTIFEEANSTPEKPKIAADILNKISDKEWERIYKENERWEKIYKTNAEQMEKTEMKTFPTSKQKLDQPPQFLLEAITDQGLAQTAETRAQAREELNQIDGKKWTEIYKKNGSPVQTNSFEEKELDLEKFNKLPEEELRKIYEKAGLNPAPIKESTLEKFKEKISDLVERIDAYIYDKAISLKQSTKEVYTALKDKVKNKQHDKQQSIPASKGKPEGYSR